MTRRIIKSLFLLFCLVLLGTSFTVAQKKKFDLKKGKSLLNKVKQVTKPEEKNNNTVTLPPVESTEEVSNSDRKLKPPDVIEQIKNAESAFESVSYNETRFYIKEAIRGIELEIGHDILMSMPDNINGIDYEENEDKVYSTGVGFAGMEVSRTYYGSDGLIRASIANSAAFNSAAKMALSSGNYSGFDDNSKIIRYKEYKALVELDESSGFELSVPFGQSSVFILKCEICQTEDELFSIADNFDFNEFKNLFGEE